MSTTAQKFPIVLINTTNAPTAYDVEAHKPGCRDIKKKMDWGDTPWLLEVSSQHEAYMEYNADFIDEADGDESNGYPILFLPCTGNVPKH